MTKTFKGFMKEVLGQLYMHADSKEDIMQDTRIKEEEDFVNKAMQLQ